MIKISVDYQEHRVFCKIALVFSNISKSFFGNSRKFSWIPINLRIFPKVIVSRDNDNDDNDDDGDRRPDRIVKTLSSGFSRS